MFIEFLGKVHFFLTGSDPINLFSELYLMFFSYQIIRAKIEPDKTIFSALIAPILIVHPAVSA